MSTFKNAIKSLYNKKIVSLLIIIQLVMAFSSLLEWIIFKYNTNNYQSYYNNIVKTNDTYTLNPLSIASDLDIMDKIGKNADGFFKYINENSNVISHGTFVDVGTAIETNDKNVDYDKLKKKINMFYNGQDSLYITIVELDDVSYDFFGIKPHEGKSFSKDDFYKRDNEAKNIILGYELKEFYPIGSYLDFGGIGRYKVIGFLPPDYLFFKGGGDVSKSLQNMNMSGIVPMSKKDYSDSINKYYMFTNTMFKLKNNDKKTLSSISLKAKSLNLKVAPKLLKDSIQNTKNDFNEDIFHEVFISIIILIFASITLIFTIVNNIMSRKREFGIMIAYGGKFSDITKMVVVENLILVGIAWMINLLMFYIKYHGQNNNNNITIDGGYLQLTLTTFLQFSLVIPIIVLIVIIVPIVKIYKLSPKDLIGGIE